MKTTQRQARRNDDPGLQPERTALAWRRTSLALLVISSVLLRWQNQHGGVVLIPFAFALIPSLMSAIRLNDRYDRKRESICIGRAQPEIAMILAMTTALVAMALTTGYIIFVDSAEWIPGRWFLP